MRIYNVFEKYLKGIELIRNSSCRHPFDESPVFYYKRAITASHSFKFAMFLHSKSCSKEISQLTIMIPPWFQECIYWMKSVIWRHLLEPFIFYIIVLLFQGSTWSDPYVKDAMSISPHLLQTSILLQAVCGWFEENWIICLFEESHFSPALLKVPIYSIELAAVIFVSKVLS